MKTILILMMLMSSWNAFAQSADKGGNGGDTILLNKAEVYNFVTQQMKIKLQETLNYIILNPKEIEVVDESLLEQLKRFMDQGLLQNIQLYELDPYHSVCIDNQGAEKGMVFEPNDEKGKICVAPQKILDSGYHTESDLVGLLYHEHLHGFSVEDKDHFGGAFVKKYYLKMMSAKPQKVQQGSTFQFLDLEVAKTAPFVTVEIEMPVYYWSFDNSSIRHEYVQATHGSLQIFRGQVPNWNPVPFRKSEVYLEEGLDLEEGLALLENKEAIFFSNSLHNAVKNLTAKRKDREKTLCPEGTVLTEGFGTFICAMVKMKIKIASSFLKPGDSIVILGQHYNVPNEDPFKDAASTKPFAPVMIRVLYGEHSQYLDFTVEKKLESLARREVAIPFQKLWVGTYYTRTTIPVGQILR